MALSKKSVNSFSTNNDNFISKYEKKSFITTNYVNNINYSLNIFVLFDDVVGSDHDLGVALLDVASLDLKDCVVHDVSVGV